jgi:uncharacterized protein GlcG (DUF336 family)
MIKTAIVTLGLLVLVSAAQAQVTFNGAPWPPAGRSDPTRMPGDMTTPPVEETLQPFDAKKGPRTLPPPVDTPRVPLDISLSAAQTIIETCKAQGLLVAASITDAQGVLQVGLSAEGASPPGRIYGGVPKAVAAIAFKQPTSVTRAQLMADPSRKSEVTANMLLLPGGLPVIVNGQVIGAIGVSGATADQDEVCARAGLEKIMSKLEAH